MTDELPGYKEYVIAAVDGRMEDAKRHLLDAIAAARTHGAKPVLAAFAQNLGALLLKQGDPLSAMALYEISEELDSGSLLAKLDHAKFLLNDMQDKEKAVTKCKEIIDGASANPFPETENDFSSEEYKEAAERLIEKAAQG